MRLPNGENADLGSKLEEYSLNFEHRQGKHKAFVFASALGITLSNAHVLRHALQSAAATSEAAIHKGHNGFGATFQLDFSLTTSSGTATVVSGWIIRDGENFPRLVTCFIF